MTLTKTDFFYMSSSGSNAYTFLDYMNVRVHQVDTLHPKHTHTHTLSLSLSLTHTHTHSHTHIHTQVLTPGNGPVAQYAAVSFTLGAEYRVNQNTGVVVPTP